MNIQLFMTKIVVCNTADQQKYIRMRVKNRTHVQGRRHGFESGGRQILRAKRAENFLNPHFLASGGQNTALTLV